MAVAYDEVARKNDAEAKKRAKCLAYCRKLAGAARNGDPRAKDKCRDILSRCVKAGGPDKCSPDFRMMVSCLCFCLENGLSSRANWLPGPGEMETGAARRSKGAMRMDMRGILKGTKQDEYIRVLAKLRAIIKKAGIKPRATAADVAKAWVNGGSKFRAGR